MSATTSGWLEQSVPSCRNMANCLASTSMRGLLVSYTQRSNGTNYCQGSLWLHSSLQFALHTQAGFDESLETTPCVFQLFGHAASTARTNMKFKMSSSTFFSQMPSNAEVIGDTVTVTLEAYTLCDTATWRGIEVPLNSLVLHISGRLPMNASKPCYTLC